MPESCLFPPLAQLPQYIHFPFTLPLHAPAFEKHRFLLQLQDVLRGRHNIMHRVVYQ